jgi:DNA-binding NarL/FixJ family response regulator
MGEPGESGGTHVLLVAHDGPIGLSFLNAFENATLDVEWTRTFDELRARGARRDVRSPEVVFVDLELEGAVASELVHFVRDGFPAAKVVVLADDLKGERAARLLAQGVPSLQKPVCPIALAGLALRLSLGASPPPWLPSDGADGRLEAAVASYASERVLSKQQRLILRQYLHGMNDKQIAELCGCSEATVYEHWRRMARKAGGNYKGDAIADFHRFLGG